MHLTFQVLFEDIFIFTSNIATFYLNLNFYMLNQINKIIMGDWFS